MHACAKKTVLVVSTKMAVSEVDICNYAYEGRTELLRQSLEKLPSAVNERDSSRRSALHWASSSGREDITTLLISKGAEVGRY